MATWCRRWPDLPAEPVDEPVLLRSTGGRIVRSGPWRVPRTLRVESEYGGAKLDLSQAVIDYPVIDLELQLAYGHARIVLPAWAGVDTDGVQLEWGRVILRGSRRSVPERVLVRITGHLGHGRLKIRHRRT